MHRLHMFAVDRQAFTGNVEIYVGLSSSRLHLYVSNTIVYIYIYAYMFCILAIASTLHYSSVSACVLGQLGFLV